MNAVLGTRMKLVRGYNGPADILLALERGEVQGMCGMVNTIVGTQRPDWLRDSKVRILVQIGLERTARMGDVPFVLDYAKSEDDKRVLRLIFGWTIMGRPFLAPPGIPEDRKAALRQGVRRHHARSGVPGGRSQAAARDRADHGARSTASWPTSTRRRGRWSSAPEVSSPRGSDH